MRSDVREREKWTWGDLIIIVYTMREENERMCVKRDDDDERVRVGMKDDEKNELFFSFLVFIYLFIYLSSYLATTPSSPLLFLLLMLPFFVFYFFYFSYSDVVVIRSYIDWLASKLGVRDGGWIYA